MKAKKFALILVAVLIAALLAGCLAACNKDEKPMLTVTIGNQQVPYSMGSPRATPSSSGSARSLTECLSPATPLPLFLTAASRS